MVADLPGKASKWSCATLREGFQHVKAEMDDAEKQLEQDIAETCWRWFTYDVMVFMFSKKVGLPYSYFFGGTPKPRRWKLLWKRLLKLQGRQGEPFFG